MKNLFNIFGKAGAAVLMAAVCMLGIASCNKGEDLVKDGKPSFVIQNKNSVENFNFGETRTFEVKASNIASQGVSAPYGWSASYENAVLTVTAPASSAYATLSGNVTVTYEGTDGSTGEAKLAVALVSTGDPDPNRPRGSFDIQVNVTGSTVTCTVTPDDPTADYWVTFDWAEIYMMFDTDEEYMAYDLDYWTSEYGDNYDIYVMSGTRQFQQTDVENGMFVICAYYVNESRTEASGFSRSDIFTVYDSGNGEVESDEPYLGLGYYIDNGDVWDGYLDGAAGNGVIICGADPNSAVVDYYVGLYKKSVADEYTDDMIRTNLKSNEAFHNAGLQFFAKEWNSEWVLCGFWVDKDGNEGPVERLPIVVALEDAANWYFVDYEGDWTVSGTNMSGNKVSYDITFEENVYNDSFKVWGFTQTGYDRQWNAPVKVDYNNGILTFRQKDDFWREDDTWMGFLGLFKDPDNPTSGRLYSYYTAGSEIFTAVRSGNQLKITWKSIEYYGESLPFFAFTYGEINDDGVNEYIVPFDEDMDYVIVSDLTFTKKNSSSKSSAKHLKTKRFTPAAR